MSNHSPAPTEAATHHNHLPGQVGALPIPHATASKNSIKKAFFFIFTGSLSLLPQAPRKGMHNPSSAPPSEQGRPRVTYD